MYCAHAISCSLHSCIGARPLPLQRIIMFSVQYFHTRHQVVCRLSIYDILRFIVVVLYDLDIVMIVIKHACTLYELTTIIIIRGMRYEEWQPIINSSSSIRNSTQ